VITLNGELGKVDVAHFKLLPQLGETEVKC
jgi:hypothetical protein